MLELLNDISLLILYNILTIDSRQVLFIFE